MLLAQVVCLTALVSSSVMTIDLERVKNLQMQLEEGATVDDLFHQFKITFDKVYLTVREKMSRREIFESNLAVIKKHNEQYRRKDSTYAMGINKFTDMGDCGSCWAFGTTGGIEGQLYKNTGESIDLSKQQLISCDPQSDKCEGGFADYAYEYVMAKGGLQSEKDYPYIAENGTCRDDRGENVPGTAIKCYKVLPEGDEKFLQYTVATRGPVVVSIDSNHNSFHEYAEGIYYEPHCTSKNAELDHAVLVVGYGNKPKPYWLVKNCWGTDWGDGGYIKMTKDKDNNCGIASDATIPILKGDKKWNRNKRAIVPNDDYFICDGQNTSAGYTTATYSASVISILAVVLVLLRECTNKLQF